MSTSPGALLERPEPVTEDGWIVLSTAENRQPALVPDSTIDELFAWIAPAARRIEDAGHPAWSPDADS